MEIPQKPRTLSLSALPNPFNSSCRITVNENAIVEVFDLRGNVVGENSLNHGFNGLNGLHGLSAPNNKNRTFIWTTDETIASGIYLVRAYFNG